MGFPTRCLRTGDSRRGQCRETYSAADCYHSSFCFFPTYESYVHSQKNAISYPQGEEECRGGSGEGGEVALEMMEDVESTEENHSVWSCRCHPELSCSQPGCHQWVLRQAPWDQTVGSDTSEWMAAGLGTVVCKPAMLHLSCLRREIQQFRVRFPLDALISYRASEEVQWHDTPAHHGERAHRWWVVYNNVPD